MTERWRTVPGWADYEVSSIGRVRRVRAANNGFTGLRQPYHDKSGRPLLMLRRANGERRTFMISRLVALAFLPPPDAGRTDVAHNDGNNQNNLVDNLRWATKAENEADKVLHGRTNRGSRNGRATLSETQVLEILERCRSGETQGQISRDLNIPQTTISCIVTGRSWSSLTGIQTPWRDAHLMGGAGRLVLA